ncbi:hypothetical protein AHAS_Ahas13G0379600 [Arachis hypogaea]
MFPAISVVADTIDPKLLFRLSLRVAINDLSKLTKHPQSFASIQRTTRGSKSNVCETVFDDALERAIESRRRTWFLLELGIHHCWANVTTSGRITILDLYLHDHTPF